MDIEEINIAHKPSLQYISMEGNTFCNSIKHNLTIILNKSHDSEELFLHKTDPISILDDNIKVHTKQVTFYLYTAFSKYFWIFAANNNAER